MFQLEFKNVATIKFEEIGAIMNINTMSKYGIDRFLATSDNLMAILYNDEYNG